MIEYQIQEYRGRHFKNMKSMERAFAKEENWWGYGTVAIPNSEGPLFRPRPATREEALAKLAEENAYYGKSHRYFRLVQREIPDWEVVS